MPRRASVFVSLGFAVALVLVAGISAGAETGDGSIKAKKTDVTAAQDRLMEIRMQAGAAEASYTNALYEMNQLNGQIAGAKEDLDGARKRFEAAKKSLEERAALVYKSQNVAFMDVLVGVDSFSEFASRLDLWIRLLGRERADFVEVREAKKDLVARKDRLEAERRQRMEAVERAMAQRERAKKAEARAEAYLDSLNADLRAAIHAAQDRRAEQAKAAAAAIIEPAPQPEGEKESKPAPRPVPVPEAQPEPIPEVEASEVKQVPVPKPDLGSEQAAADREAAAKAAAAQARRLAEQRAAERKAAREAEQQAAAEQRAAARAARLAQQRAARQEAREEAQRQAELAAERAAARRAARKEAERQAERAAEIAAIEEAAAQQAAAERAAARRAAERRAERLAEQRAAAREAEQAAEASASASAAAAQKAAERADARREARAAEASASASASSSASAPAAQGGGRGGEAASASSSASASASASSSAAPGGGGTSAMGGDVLAVAQQHLGTPYVPSPPGPCAAFEAEDCSCFTLLVFQEFGIALPDSPAGQMGYGTPVSGAPQAGDLLFWSEDGSGYITHVGIAMGDGTTIHASTDLYGEGVVTITNINHINGYVGARRLL
jgi:cell wall-associated NlpC family hydrolase/peptidoglycan hydrolase CwlO-like protein